MIIDIVTFFAIAINEGRKREKAYREKRKAKKIAENGGEIVKKKVCPHCGKEFTPASNRQIFCTKECCNQARQDKVKADRVGETRIVKFLIENGANKEYKTQNGLGLLECSERVEKLFEDSSLKEFIENNQ